MSIAYVILGLLFAATLHVGFILFGGLIVPGAKADPLRAAAEEKGLKVHQFKSLRDADAHEALKGLKADIGIMAYVLQFAPDTLVKIPRFGTIQYHPSLLPKYRGRRVEE